TTSGTGAQSIIFNGNITGGQDISLSGTSTGSYTFTLHGITTNHVDVTAAAGSSNNFLTLDSGSNQSFNIAGTNTGTVTNIETVAGNFDFTNIHNLTGGSNDDTFTLIGSGSLSGAINGGAGTTYLVGGNVANYWTINAINGGM